MWDQGPADLDKGYSNGLLPGSSWIGSFWWKANLKLIDNFKSLVRCNMGDGKSDFSLELTWLRDRKEPYNLGENEFHLAFVTDDYEAAFKKHSEMGCVCFNNEEMGIYFINDPDNYWIEVVPAK